MSSILKALKKLEDEKLLQQETAGINVSSEILRQQPENKKLVFWLWITGIASFATIATLTFLLVNKTPQAGNMVAIPAAPLPAKKTILQPAAGAVITAPPAISGGKHRTSPSTLPEESYRQQISPAGPPQQPQPTTDKSSKTEMPASHFPSPETPRPESRKPLQPDPPEKTDAAVTLSGIAWNKDSSDRLAIINGQPTSTGATVNGVVVEEIMPDRVKVNSGGRSFEIFLGKPIKSN